MAMKYCDKHKIWYDYNDSCPECTKVGRIAGNIIGGAIYAGVWAGKKVYDKVKEENLKSKIRAEQEQIQRNQIASTATPQVSVSRIEHQRQLTHKVSFSLSDQSFPGSPKMEVLVDNMSFGKIGPNEMRELYLASGLHSVKLIGPKLFGFGKSRIFYIDIQSEMTIWLAFSNDGGREGLLYSYRGVWE